MLLFDNIWRNTSVGADFVSCYYVTLCALKEGIAIALCAACVLSVLMIGVDQYFAVIDPLRYHSSINATSSVIMIVLAWTVSASFGVFGSLNVNERSPWLACERLSQQDFSFLPKIYQLIFPLVFVLLIFVVPFGSICWIYVSICSAARENNERTKRNGSTHNCVTESAPLDYTIVSTIHESVEYTPTEKKTPSIKSLHHSSTKSSLKSTSSFIVNSLRHRISNASMFRYREDTRAARISILVIVMTLICWLPFTLTLLLHSPLFGKIDIPSPFKQIGILTLSLNTVVSPLIFAHRNRRIHRELCKLCRMTKKGTSFYANVKSPMRHKSFKRKPIYVATESKNNDSLLSLTTDHCVIMETPKKSISILNRMWSIASKDQERNQDSLRLPEVAFETDTSRSSFSSNASSGSNHRSTSAASISDVAEEV